MNELWKLPHSPTVASIKTIQSKLVRVAGLCGILVANSADWANYGEAAWGDMMAQVRARPSSQRIMGIDSEWFNKNPLAVVQVATATHCFVIHLSYMDQRVLPVPVRDAFSDPGIIKCGVGIEGDVKRLQAEQRFTMHTVMNLADYSVWLELIPPGQSNLCVLTGKVAGVPFEKDHWITRSNWELALSQNQADYAADDAVASFLVGARILEKVRANLGGVADFDVAAWLQQTQQRAAQAFKRAQRQYSKEKALKQQQHKNGAQPDGEDGAGEGASASAAPLLSQFGASDRVRVLNQAGQLLFECSQGRAKFYVLEKGIARVTKHHPKNPRRAMEIQLLFDPQVKTRLCMYFLVGQCDLGDSCPFAHGIEQLTEESRTLLTSSTASCACCLATRNLMRHAIVPPSFRCCLPGKWRFPRSTEDYVPICMQCNTVLRHYYDAEMERVYKEADNQLPEPLQISLIAKCVSYARLLTSAEKLKRLPEDRQDAIRSFIRENWVTSQLAHLLKEELEATSDPSTGEIVLSDEFLHQLSRVVPGDVRSKATMKGLVGSDESKAADFVERWRRFCFTTCGMREKESNKLSPEEWERLRV